MAKESDINFSASELTKNNKQKLRKTLRKYGLSILLIQLILGSISTLLLSSIVVNIPERISLEINLSLFFSICGLICLIVSICSCFYFNKVIISQLSKTFLVQSIKSVATKVIKISIVSSFLGVCLTLFSIDILGWIILSRAISASQILFSSHNPYSYIFSTHNICPISFC